MRPVVYLAHARPSDLVFLGYVAGSGILVAGFGWRLPVTVWVGLSAAHLAMFGLGLWFARRGRADHAWAGFLRDIYPLFFIVFLYWELRFLAQIFADGYHDAAIQRLEAAIFGEQLAMSFSERLPVLWLSELFHLFYALYWLLLPLGLGLLYWRDRLAGFRELIYVELVVFFFCYVIFIFFPVAGPHYEFAPIGGDLADGPLYRFVHWVLADGGSKGAAFPSSHVAVAVAILLVTWRHDRLIWAIMLPLVVGLTVGTVYGRFHYAIDAASGVLTGLLVVPLARRLRPWLARATSAGAGNSDPGSSI